MIIFAFASMLIALLAVVFALSNTAATSVNFVVWSFQGSLALILLGALFAGILITFFGTVPSLVRNRWTIRQLRKKLQAAEDVLIEHNLMAAPAPAEPKHKKTDPKRTPVAPAAKLPDLKPLTRDDTIATAKPAESIPPAKSSDAALAAKSSDTGIDSPQKPNTTSS